MNTEFEISKGTTYAEVVMDGWAIALNPNNLQYKMVIPMSEFEDGLLKAYEDYKHKELGLFADCDRTTLKQITGSAGPCLDFAIFYRERWLNDDWNRKYSRINWKQSQLKQPVH